MLVKCPKCSNILELTDGVKSFGCDNCGEKLFLLDDKVITKGQAQAMLNTLIAKRNARRAAEAASALGGAPAVPNTGETVAPASVRSAPIIQRKPVAPKPAPTPAPVLSVPARPTSAYEDPVNLKPTARTPIAAAPSAIAKPSPSVADMDSFNVAPKKKSALKPIELEEAIMEPKREHVEGNAYIKSGAAGGITMYLLFTAVMFLWLYLLQGVVLPIVKSWNEIAYLVVYYYSDVLVLLAWICASSSFMALGVVRRKPINFKAEMIASGCTVLNIPNMPLMAVCNADRKKFDKYCAGNKFNFAPGYIATTVIFEIIALGLSIWPLVNVCIFMLNIDTSHHMDYLFSFLTNANIYCYFIIIGISLSRLIKLCVRGKKMVEKQK